MYNSPVISLALRYLSVFETGVDGRVRLAPLSQNKAFSSVLGLSLGVMVLIIVLSIVNGFEREMRERVLAVLPHVVLFNAEGITDWKATDLKLKQASDEFKPLASAPLENLQALLVNGQALAAIELKGILPSAEKQVSIIDDLMLEGTLDNLELTSFGIVLGSRLAEKLGVLKGDYLKVMLPEARMSLLGVLPRYRQFEVVGVFEIGAVLDEHLAYIHIDAAGKLLRKRGVVSALRLSMPDLFDAPWHGWQLANYLNESLQSEAETNRRDSSGQGQNLGQTINHWQSSDWTDSQGSLYQIITMTKSMLGLLVLLIVVVACFNLASGLIMLVSDKRSDIAILLSQGFSPSKIMQVFVLQAILIAVSGLLLGFSVGALLLSFLQSWVLSLETLLGLDLTSAYPVHYLPFELLVSDVILVSISVLILSFIASLYPARLAAKVNPAEELKYE